MRIPLYSRDMLSDRFVVNILCLLAWTCCCFCETPDKVCTGTSFGLRRTGHAGNWSLQRYIRMYSNCVYVDGNLEITYLENGSYDLSFLSTIKEVSGYVVIAFVRESEIISLRNLRVIRGDTLLHEPNDPSGVGYSLYVANNYEQNSPGVGLKELQLTALHEIVRGSVMFDSNYDLCYVNTIAWSDIWTGPNATTTHKLSDPSQPLRQCGQCDAACDTDGELHCWGAGPDMCQTLVRRCSPQCGDSCYGPGPTECCDRRCIGGCHGREQTECYACEDFINDGECVTVCPPPFIYNRDTRENEPNPDGKYTYGVMCVASCPAPLVVDEAYCVSDCGEHKVAVGGKCQPCDGPCPKVCDAPEHVHADNIADLTGCTVIRGILRIINSANTNTRPASREQLEVLISVKEITGALVVKTNATDIVDLSFLRNLRDIHGRNPEHGTTAIVIVRTNLQSLGLQSLRRVAHGRIFIGINSRLCYAETVNWERITGRVNVTRLKLNGQQCGSCSSFCDSDGCWGPGDDECIQCAGYRMQGHCVEYCDLANGYYANSTTRECWPCNPECLNSCTGPGNDQCDACRHVQDGPYCKAECPQSTFADDTQMCRDCDLNCLSGCTGPANRLGRGGCNACDVVVYEPGKSYCLRPRSDCPQNFFSKFARDNWTASRYVECRPCHPLCNGCSGPSSIECNENECSGYQEANDCVESCSSDFYTDDVARQCMPCDQQCLECRGPTADDCTLCRYMKLYNDLEDRTPDSLFTCMDHCPESAPAELLEVTDDETTAVCVTWEIYNSEKGGLGRSHILAIVGGVLAALLLIGVIIVAVVYFKRQWARSEENKARINARLAGEDEILPLSPSSASPDMAQMRIITDNELHLGDVIGSGAFGTVYKGIWMPPNENVKLPVAVKVLNEGSSVYESRELLDEARIMASVVHPYCLRVVAVCLAARLMLVVPLMPLGSLLDYLHKNRANIESKRMLNWATQIARGMEYLEARGIVHRDLAARNVLVLNANVVKITDFGLAKLLDANQDVFKAAGGKMPIKWLALESIEHRIFTHKSDVWSYGVTLWELFSYGERPYEGIRSIDIPSYLERGTRLAQPTICTIDVYMILIKCWLVDAECRPSFTELAEEFSKMARDPGRYLVIDGDEQKRMPLHNDYKAAELITDVGGNAEGPEELLTVDEYLMPLRWTEDEKKNDEKRDSVNGKKNRLKTGDSLKIEKKFKDLETASASSASRKSRGRKRSASYTSDPCTPPKDEQMSGISAGTAAVNNADDAATELDRMLIADEDNYLTPQPDVVGQETTTEDRKNRTSKPVSSSQRDRPRSSRKSRRSDHVPDAASSPSNFVNESRV